MIYTYTPEKGSILQDNLKELREYLGYSRKEFADLFGYSVSRINDLENRNMKLRGFHWYALIAIIWQIWETREAPIREDELTRLFTDPGDTKAKVWWRCNNGTNV